MIAVELDQLLRQVLLGRRKSTIYRVMIHFIYGPIDARRKNLCHQLDWYRWLAETEGFSNQTYPSRQPLIMLNKSFVHAVGNNTKTDSSISIVLDSTARVALDSNGARASYLQQPKRVLSLHRSVRQLVNKHRAAAQAARLLLEPPGEARKRRSWHMAHLLHPRFDAPQKRRHLRELEHLRAASEAQGLRQIA